MSVSGSAGYNLVNSCFYILHESCFGFFKIRIYVFSLYLLICIYCYSKTNVFTSMLLGHANKILLFVHAYGFIVIYTIVNHKIAQTISNLIRFFEAIHSIMFIIRFSFVARDPIGIEIIMVCCPIMQNHTAQYCSKNSRFFVFADACPVFLETLRCSDPVRGLATTLFQTLGAPPTGTPLFDFWNRDTHCLVYSPHHHRTDMENSVLFQIISV